MSASRQKLAHRRARRARVRAVLHPSFTGDLFDIWRRARELWLQFFDRHDTTLVALIEREVVWRAEHRKMCDWLHHLEQLVRCLILTAAFALEVALKPRTPKPRARKRRCHIIWDNKPSTWVRLRFSIFPHASRAAKTYGAPTQKQSRFARTLPLARRLETLRRILVAPEASAGRAAFHLARLQAANVTSNQPRTLVMNDAPPPPRTVSRGHQATESAFEKLLPLCEDRMDAWARRTEPG